MTLMLPCEEIDPEEVIDPELTVPVVSIVVEPPIVEDPVIVAALRILLVSVDAPASVTITPDAGYVAVELTPVPPLAEGNRPVTAAD